MPFAPLVVPSLFIALEHISQLTLKNLPRAFYVSERNLRKDLQSVGFQRNKLARVIAQDAHRMDIQRRKNLGADAVLTLFAAKRDRFVGINALFPVCVNLRDKIRLTRLAHLCEIKQYPAPLRCNDVKGTVHLLMAMAGH